MIKTGIHWRLSLPLPSPVPLSLACLHPSFSSLYPSSDKSAFLPLTSQKQCSIPGAQPVAWVRIPGLTLTGRAILGQRLNFTVPQFPHLYTVDAVDDSIYLTGLFEDEIH